MLKKKLDKLSLMAILSLSLFACDKYPDVHPKLVNIQKHRVIDYSLVDRQNLKFQAGQYEDLNVIDGGFCFSSQETADVLSWARRQLNKNCTCIP